MTRTPLAERVLPALNLISDALRTVRPRPPRPRRLRSGRSETKRLLQREIATCEVALDGPMGFDHVGRPVPIYTAEYCTTERPVGLLLLLPFTAAHSRQMRPFARAMSRLGFHAATIDLPGHGRSGGDRGKFHIGCILQTIGDVAACYRDRYPEWPIGLVGSSWGGDLAILAALWEEHQWQETGRPRCLAAVMAQAVIVPWLRRTITRFHPGLALLFDSRQIGVRVMRTALGPRLPVRRMFKPRDLYDDGKLRRRFIADRLALRSYDTRSYLEYLTYLPPVGPESLTIPLLVMSGSRDRLVPHGYQRFVYQALRARHAATLFAAVDGGTHGMFEEQTGQVAQQAADWFREIFSGRPPAQRVESISEPAALQCGPPCLSER